MSKIAKKMEYLAGLDQILALEKKEVKELKCHILTDRIKSIFSR